MNEFDYLLHELYTTIEDRIFNGENPAKYEVHNSWPLDPRAKTAGWYVKDNCLIVEAHGVRALEYYGGFEYIDGEDKFLVGPYMVYRGDHDRVRPIIEQFNHDPYEYDSVHGHGKNI